jgi:hypothetical protein
VDGFTIRIIFLQCKGKWSATVIIGEGCPIIILLKYADYYIARIDGQAVGNFNIVVYGPCSCGISSIDYRHL